MSIEFTVLGTPQPQGSLRSLGTGRPLLDSNKQLEPWRHAVAAQALTAMHNHKPFTGPLRLHALFVFSRPAGHFGTGRNSGQLKPSAPLYVQTRPDLDKLLRAVGDAITGIVCRDDNQLVIVHAEKHYGQPACAHLVLEELTPKDDRPAELGS
jgi:crossover junction endodeoxyribonuclease RusA